MRTLTFLILALALVACGVNPTPAPVDPSAPSSVVPSTSPAPIDPDEPLSSSPDASAGPVDLPADHGGMRVTPTAGLLNINPVSVERFELSPDGMTLHAYYWGGVDSCYTLASADLELPTQAGETAYFVSLSEGTRPEAADVACIAIAEMKYAVIELPEPVLADTTAAASGEIAEPISGAVLAQPTDKELLNVRPTAIVRFELAADGLSGRVYFYGGIPECYGIAPLEIAPAQTGPGYEMTVREGALPNVDTPCIDIGLLKVTDFTLEQPVLSASK